MRIAHWIAPLLLAACGGGTSGWAPPGDTTGGGGAPTPPPSAPPPTDPPPTAPAPLMMAADRFGVLNETAEPLVYFGWWETRPENVEGIPEAHWLWVVPMSGPIAPGALYVKQATNGPFPLPMPEEGVPLDVAAVGASGRWYTARVVYAPPASGAWRVR